MSPEALLEIKDLAVTYSRGLGRAPFVAVHDLSLTLGRGETVSIVGESGSGKSTIGSAVLGLQPAAAGRIVLEGSDITRLSPRRRRELRSTLQAVFQDPFSSLDPSQTIGEAVAEPLKVAELGLTSAERTDRVVAMLEKVGIGREAMSKFPAEFSGGQRQRIAIARALVLEPKIVVCDEAVSALDVSVQAQVLNLLEQIQREAGTSYIFISHNMAVVRHISDRVVVLYRGRVMEEGAASDVCDRPAHPYTRSLLASVPVPDVVAQKLRREARALANASTGLAPQDGVGCPFAPRCPYAQQKCVETTPPLVETGDGRKAACLRLDEIPAPDDVPALRVVAVSAVPVLGEDS
ncbi:MAG: ABC transporter ATP-binding protein [Pseudolysinimonas sp.]|uniref:ABC transporter ATP-binding protein n=1 Tax=Pseudolysinimonas sp. TaxID=2680009 RepID=UPI003265066C